jgi:hypothetical protein
MVLIVNFKNGRFKEFRIDDFYISDNDTFLHMRKDGVNTGMINLFEVMYYFVEDAED